MDMLYTYILKAVNQCILKIVSLCTEQDYNPAMAIGIPPIRVARLIMFLITKFNLMVRNSRCWHFLRLTFKWMNEI
jgi:hypothetical protein